MWKKDRLDGPEPTPFTPPPAPSKAHSPAECSVIGPSIAVKGEVTGAEDLLVEGTFEGTIDLKKNVVTIGQAGRVTANVCGRVIHIEGEVTGDCVGTEQIILHKSGQVKGNLCAPRVSVEDGARLQGTIDTGANQEVPADVREPRHSTPMASDEPHPMV